MPICPECNYENELDRVQCEQCGTLLIHAGKLEKIPLSDQEIGGIPTESLDPNIADAKASAERLVGFHHAESGKFFAFPETGNFIVGRISEGQSILPDVDFSPIQGFEAGVSRLHALVTMAPKGFFLSDLGSSNGTAVNGKKIDPHVEQEIRNGDKIQFGRLLLEAVISQ